VGSARYAQCWRAQWRGPRLVQSGVVLAAKLTANASTATSRASKQAPGLIYRTIVYMAGARTPHKSCDPKSPKGVRNAVALKRNTRNVLTTLEDRYAA
jgi:hypothetical protein